MNTRPYWLDGEGCGGGWPRVEESLATDVLVIGGGITGITAAWLLASRGIDVVLVEREDFATRDTGHTTAHLTYMTDTRLSDLVASVGRSDALLSWRAGFEAMDCIRRAVDEERIDCDLKTVPGYLVAAEGSDLKAEASHLAEEVETARIGGFPVSFIEQAPVTKRPAIHFPDQMEFHPLRYLRGLLHSAEGKGARVFAHSEAGEFDAKQKRVKVGGHWIGCRNVVIATHVPLQGSAGMLGAALLQTKLALYSTYAVGARIPLHQVREMIWSDTADPFLYLRMQRLGDSGYAILGGEDHKTGEIEENEERYRRLELALAGFLPEAVVTHRWSGQVVETVDGLPYIGATDDWQFISTGFSGNGMTFGTLAGMMAEAWVGDRATPWDELFSPGRKTPSSVMTYLEENAAFPVRLVSDRLKVRKGNPETLAPGEGKLMMHEGQCTAACRNASGELHLCSPVCPHLGCFVAWNAAESTWDCPCHGSRFTAEGRVIGGPAESDLRSLKA
jgi:glycine/D-amino acid oxidase-like deaminating enzyme/nitrite reductase/ring-hydroxylating ferredoxin subunit